METMSKEQMRLALLIDHVDVTFTKKNGEQRVMTCTLRRDEVPQYERKTDRVRAEKQHILPVWDVTKKDWRSFDVRSVTDFNTLSAPRKNE